MLNVRLPCLLPLLVLVVACRPDANDGLPLAGTGCGLEGSRIQATVSGSSWCANASVTAVASIDGSAMITGVALSGHVLTTQIDSIGLGTHPINEMDNAVLWMAYGTPYTPRSTHPGTLTILTQDADAHRLTAHLEVVLYSESDGSSRSVAADLDVTYTIE